MPDLLFEAHSSVLDLVFCEGQQFPAEWRGSALAQPAGVDALLELRAANERCPMVTDRKEAAMSYRDPLNPMPPRPSEIDPLPTQQPGSNPPRYQNMDVPWRTGTIASAIIAVLVVVGLIVWASSTHDQQTTSNPPAQTTGQTTK